MTPQENGIDELDSFFISEKEAEVPKRGMGEAALRKGKRYLQRGGETLLGLPGDVVQLVRGMAASLPGGVSPEEEGTFVQRAGSQLLESIPGSEELRAKSAESYPELEPETEFEEAEDEFVSDVAALAIPVKGKIPFARSLGLATVGNLGKKITKELGMSEKAQDMTKMGLMVFSGMFGRGRGVKSHINNLYKEAEGYVPKGQVFNYPTKKLGKVEAILRKGSLDEAKTPAFTILEDIKSKIKSGRMPVEEAVQFDKDINRAIGRSFNDKSKAGYLKQVKAANSEALDVYAKENPSWGERWKDAKQAYQGIATSENIKGFIRKNADLKNLTYGAAFLGLEEAALPGHALAKLGGLGTAATALYTKEMAKRLATNPALRRYYANVLNASLSENKAMLTRNLAGLERVAKKEFEKDPLPIFNIDEE